MHATVGFFVPRPQVGRERVFGGKNRFLFYSISLYMHLHTALFYREIGRDLLYAVDQSCRGPTFESSRAASLKRH